MPPWEEDHTRRAMPGHDPKDPVPEAPDFKPRRPAEVSGAVGKVPREHTPKQEAPKHRNQTPTRAAAPSARPSRRVRLRETLAKRDGWTCCWCGCALDRDSATLEHVIPRSHGGTKAQTNLRLACQACNARRGDKARWVPPSAASEVPLNPHGHVDGSGRGLEDGECIYCESSGSLILEPCPARLIGALRDAQRRLDQWEQWLRLIEGCPSDSAKRLASMAKKALAGEDPP